MDSDRSPERPLDLDGIAADLDGVEVALERLAAGTYWNDHTTDASTSAEPPAEQPTAQQA